MEYKDLLKKYIEESKWSLREIEEKMREKGLSTNKAYISKLQNGIHPPAGEDINRALAEVTGGDPEALVKAAYIEKAPVEMKETLALASTLDSVYQLLYYLVCYLDAYREKGTVDIELLHKIEVASWSLKDDRNFVLETSQLKDHPEYAVQWMARIKRRFFPYVNTIVLEAGTIDFSLYMDENGLRDSASDITRVSSDQDELIGLIKRLPPSEQQALKDYVKIRLDVVSPKKAEGFRTIREAGEDFVAERKNPALNQAAYDGTPSELTAEEIKKFEEKKRLFEQFHDEEEEK